MDLIRRIGDPESIGWAGYWLSTVMVLILQIAGSVTMDRLDAFPGRMALLFVVQSLMYLALVLIARPALARLRVAFRLPAALLFFAAGAVLRATLFAAMTALIGTEPLQPLFGRLLTSIGTVCLVLSVTAVIRSLAVEYSANRAALTYAQERLRDLRGRIRNQLQDDQQLLIERTQVSLYATFDKAVSSPSERRSTALRRAVDEVLRPLSHQLTEQIPSIPQRLAEPPPLPWRETLRQAAQNFRLYPAWIAGTIGWLAVTSLNSTYGMPLNLRLAALQFILLYATMLALRPAVRRLAGRMRPSAFQPFALLLVLSATVLYLALMRQIVPEQVGLSPIYIGNLIFVPLAAWAASLIGALTQSLSSLNEELIRARLQVATEEIRARTLLWSRQRSLARRIHGRVQSAITAAAIRLDFARFRGEEVPLEEIEEQILATVRELDDPPMPATLDERMSRIKRTWDGACVIEFDIETGARAALANNPEAVDSIGEITQEACSNAVRHAGALSIQIAVTATVDDAVNLTITSDADAVETTPNRPGLGSRILDDLTMAWSLEIKDGSCVLLAVVPVEADGYLEGNEARFAIQEAAT